MKIREVPNFLGGCYSIALWCLLCSLPACAEQWEQRRVELYDRIWPEISTTYTSHFKALPSSSILTALKRVPRHKYVPLLQRPFAYENRPLPIGYGQTISQPYIVGLMTALLNPKKEHKVLEIGTGSGYQAAVLSSLVERVYTLEIVPELGLAARKRFTQLKRDNIIAKVGDGYYGWSEYAPFDAIIVTAAGDHIPSALIKQLKKGGVMVIPVGPQFMVQQLIVVEKDEQGTVSLHQLLPVRFVPLMGGSR